MSFELRRAFGDGTSLLLYLAVHKRQFTVVIRTTSWPRLGVLVINASDEAEYSVNIVCLRTRDMKGRQGVNNSCSASILQDFWQPSHDCTEFR